MIEAIDAVGSAYGEYSNPKTLESWGEQIERETMMLAVTRAASGASGSSAIGRGPVPWVQYRLNKRVEQYFELLDKSVKDVLRQLTGEKNP